MLAVPSPEGCPAPVCSPVKWWLAMPSSRAAVWTHVWKDLASSEHFLLRVSTTFINRGLVPTADFLCCASWGVTWVVPNLHPSMCTTTCLQLWAAQVCSAPQRSGPQCSHWPPQEGTYFVIFLVTVSHSLSQE